MLSWESRVDDLDALKALLQSVFSNYRIPYFTIRPPSASAPAMVTTCGEQEACPTCGRATEVWSRWWGSRPIKNWNLGKQAEFQERRTFAALEMARSEDRRTGTCKPVGLPGDAVYQHLHPGMQSPLSFATIPAWSWTSPRLRQS